MRPKRYTFLLIVSLLVVALAACSTPAPAIPSTGGTGSNSSSGTNQSQSSQSNPATGQSTAKSSSASGNASTSGNASGQAPATSGIPSNEPANALPAAPANLSQTGILTSTNEVTITNWLNYPGGYPSYHGPSGLPNTGTMNDQAILPSTGAIQYDWSSVPGNPSATYGDKGVTGIPTNDPGASASAGQVPVGNFTLTPELLLQVQQFLAQNLGNGLSISQLALLSAKQVDFPDSCLGAGSANQSCAQVITPGFEATFQVNGKTYTVRADLQGKTFVLLNNP